MCAPCERQGKMEGVLLSFMLLTRSLQEQSQTACLPPSSTFNCSTKNAGKFPRCIRATFPFEAGTLRGPVWQHVSVAGATPPPLKRVDKPQPQTPRHANIIVPWWKLNQMPRYERDQSKPVSASILFFLLDLSKCPQLFYTCKTRTQVVPVMQALGYMRSVCSIWPWGHWWILKASGTWWSTQNRTPHSPHRTVSTVTTFYYCK